MINNSLNLLNEVSANSLLKAKYYYLADGLKLRVRDGAGTNGFDYIGSLTYIQSSTGISLEAANFKEFRIIPSGSTNVVQYHVTDHLGSVRAIVDASGNVIEKRDYYPFGARHKRSEYAITTNRFKYNSKEEQTTGDLKYLDYGWRNYDNTVGRWFGVDKLSEKYPNNSPYLYCINNPLIYIDPDGMDKIRFTADFKASTGKVGFNVNILGLGLGFIYGKGSGELRFKIGYEYDTDKKKHNFIAGYANSNITEYISYTFGFVGYEESIEKTIEYEVINTEVHQTKDGTIYETTSSGSLGNLSINESENVQTDIEYNVSTGTHILFIGAEAQVGLKYETTDGKDAWKKIIEWIISLF